MKKRAFPIIPVVAITYFLVINASFFWEQYLHYWEFFFILYLLGIYFVLALLLLAQIVLLLAERFKNYRRLFDVLLLTTVLLLVLRYPAGIYNFEKDDDNVLQAYHDGTICSSILQLKNDRTLLLKDVCFGVERHYGTYTVSHDTAYFHIEDAAPGTEYSFATIQLEFNHPNPNYRGTLLHYDSPQDTLPAYYTITFCVIK